MSDMPDMSEITDSEPAADSAPAAPSSPPPSAPNIDLQIFRAEAALLAETDSEALLKGLLLECRELVRGTANVISNPRHAEFHDEYLRYLQTAVRLGVDLSGAIAGLRNGGTEERRQRIIVERIEKRSLPAPAPAPVVPASAPLGGGGAPLCENE